MLPCQVCGRDAGTGWIEGFPPAPDSQKLALCREHDTPENRKLLRLAWQKMFKSSVDEFNRMEAFRSGDAQNLLTLYFTGGGSIALPCLGVAPAEPDSLKVTGLDGTVSFFPMRQVRRYTLNPLYSGTDGAAPAQNTGGTDQGGNK